MPASRYGKGGRLYSPLPCFGSALPLARKNEGKNGKARGLLKKLILRAREPLCLH